MRSILRIVLIYGFAAQFATSGSQLACLRGVNSGMQIRRSVVFLGPIRRSDLIFVQIRIRVTLTIFRGI